MSADNLAMVPLLFWPQASMKVLFLKSAQTCSDTFVPETSILRRYIAEQRLAWSWFQEWYWHSRAFSK